MGRRKKKLPPLRFLPPSKLPAKAVREMLLFCLSAWNSREALLDDYCVCKSQGRPHGPHCLYSRAEAIGKMMDWDWTERVQR